MKKVKCFLYINTANGHILQPRKFDSITEATKEGKAAAGFYYRIIDEKGRERRRGFCNQ